MPAFKVSVISWSCAITQESKWLQSMHFLSKTLTEHLMKSILLWKSPKPVCYKLLKEGMYELLLSMITIINIYCFFSDLVDQYGISVRVLGNRKLLRPDIIEAIEKVTKMSENNTK